MTPLLPFCLMIVSLSAPPSGDTPDAALLPPDGFLQTWHKSRSPRVFTAADLYGHIDGGAEIFLEFGFEQLTVQRYAAREKPDGEQPQGELVLEIYRMADPIAAEGIFLMNRGRESRDPALADRHSLNKHQLIVKRDRYYAVVNNMTGEEAFRPAMLEFARHVAARLPADRPAKILNLLPREGLRESSARLIRGPYGLQSVYTLGKGDVMQLGGKITAVAGSYSAAEGDYSLLLADYPTEEAARSAFQNARSILDRRLEVLEDADRRLVFKDGGEKYGLVSVDGTRITLKTGLSSPPRP